MKANSKFDEVEYDPIAKCYGVTKDPRKSDYLLVFRYATLGDLHNNLSKNFKKITWMNKIKSLESISRG